MTTISAHPPRSRRWFFVGASLAAALCLLAVAMMAFLPQHFRYERKVYSSLSGDAISSFSINAFVASYEQSSGPFDVTKDTQPGLIAANFANVNRVQWSIETRRVAAVLTIPAIFLVIRVARRDRAKA